MKECIAGVPPNKEIMEKICELIAFEFPIENVYRLLIVWSRVSGGLRAGDFEEISQDINAHYGITEYCRVVGMLREGFLRIKETMLGINMSVSPYKIFSEKFGLIDVEYKDNNPNLKVYPYMAYTPLMVRMFEILLQGGWAKSDLLDSYPMPVISEGDPTNLLSTIQKFKLIPEDQEMRKIFLKKVVVLYVIGGITYGEIAGFRKIAAENGVELLICTTKIINFRDVIDIFEVDEKEEKM